MTQVKPGLSEDGTKLIATDQSQLDQLADALVSFASPAPSTTADPVQPENPVPSDTLHEQEAFEFKGFEIAPGDYKVLMILRPQLDEEGKKTAPPQIVFGCNEADWKSYVREALRLGINNGTILSSDDKVLSGFTVAAQVNGSEHLQKIAFLFSQVVSFLPFKEVEAGLDEKHAAARRVWKRTLEKRRKMKAIAKAKRNSK